MEIKTANLYCYC